MTTPASLPQLSDAALRNLRSTIELPDAGDRFEVRELIGQGGMGRVYRVFDRRLEREVALKALSLDAETTDLSERLTREARVLARLEHPGIVAIHDAGMLADGRPFYLMRLVRGASLERAPMGSRGERLRTFLRVCDAVAFAHARHVIHRDIKPGNVMVGEFGEVVVLDWGVARLVGESGANERAGLVMGTPGFMAPEQAQGTSATADVRADVYGLGAVLQFLLHRAASPSATSALATADAVEQIPPPLAAIVARATSQALEHRYPTVDALADDVRRWLDAEPVSAYRESPFERILRFSRRNRTLLLLLAAYASVRVTIFLWRGV